MKIISLALIAASAIATGTTSHAKTPLTEAALSLTRDQQQLRFVTYGDDDLAPAKIWRDKHRTYIQVKNDSGQKLEVLEVTPIGYRRIPSAVEPPYIVIQGFAPSLAIQYPGRKLVFVEFGSESIKQPASPQETEIRMRERASALLDKQTQLDTAARTAAEQINVERNRLEAAQRETAQALIAAQQAKAAATEAQAVASAAVAATAAQKAALTNTKRAYDVFTVDQNLKGVLSRWAANDGLHLEWNAPENGKWNPPVAANGPVQATDIKDAIRKILLAFASKEVELQAVFYNNGVVEISQKKGAGKQ